MQKTYFSTVTQTDLLKKAITKLGELYGTCCVHRAQQSGLVFGSRPRVLPGLPPGSPARLREATQTQRGLLSC